MDDHRRLFLHHIFLFYNCFIDICQNNLSITDMKKEDIGRSHVIGKPKDGKSQVIVRFLSYRVREKVYNSKKELKRGPIVLEDTIHTCVQPA
jgi:hypothetical protein